MSPWQRMAGAALLTLWSSGAAAGQPLQPLLDAAPPGSVVRLAAGVYQGPAVIRAPLTLDGSAGAVLENDGHGSVLAIEAADVTVQHMRIRRSGQQLNDLDACLQVRAARAQVLHNRLEECLFGINIQQADGALVEDNDIFSHPLGLSLRGDGIRLWYSQDNQIKRNRVHDARDMVMWYSHRNLFEGNEASGGRYSIHLMYAHDNVIRGNRFSNNAVGIFLMYSDGALVEENEIRNAAGATGMCLGLKEVSRAAFRRNRLVYCATGFYLDHSPFQPDTRNLFEENEIAFNGVGVTLHSTLANNHFLANRFIGNFLPVVVESRGHARLNRWEGNYWDTYEGFDRDGDGVGDTPFELFLYADKLWMEAPSIRFFFGSPVLAVLDFLEQLAPFSAPAHLLSDAQPRFEAPTAGVGMGGKMPRRPLPDLGTGGQVERSAGDDDHG